MSGFISKMYFLGDLCVRCKCTDIKVGDKSLFDYVKDFPEATVVSEIKAKNVNENYSDYDEFRCSRCGLHLEDWTRIVYEDNETIYPEYAFKYCPECGAKIEVE